MKIALRWFNIPHEQYRTRSWLWEAWLIHYHDSGTKLPAVLVGIGDPPKEWPYEYVQVQVPDWFPQSDCGAFSFNGLLTALTWEAVGDCFAMDLDCMIHQNLDHLNNYAPKEGWLMAPHYDHHIEFWGLRYCGGIHLFRKNCLEYFKEFWLTSEQKDLYWRCEWAWSMAYNEYGPRCQETGFPLSLNQDYNQHPDRTSSSTKIVHYGGELKSLLNPKKD